MGIHVLFLILFSFSWKSLAVASQVEVPVPQSLLEGVAEVVLRGTVGVGQKDEWSLCAVRRDLRGQLVRESLGHCGSQKLNETATVVAGTYELAFSSSRIFIDLKNDEQRSIELVSLVVPKVSGTYEFWVFLDLTDPETQDNFLAGTWVRSQRLAIEGSGEVSLETICRRASLSSYQVKDACAAWMSGDFHRLRETQTRFTENGFYSQILWGFATNFAGDISFNTLHESSFNFSFPQRVFIGSEGHDGQSVSVLPGNKYGLRFANYSRLATELFGFPH